MNSYQAKKIPLVQILARLGHSPVRKDKGGVEWVYHSPFRNETIPSLFVNIQRNIWNDFGDIGGNVLDFVMRYDNTDLRGALRFIERLYVKNDFKAHTATKTKITPQTPQKQESLILDAVMPLKSAVLENYLKERCINIPIARNYLKVVQFHHAETSKKYFGLGLKNLSDSYEVRNPKLKTVIGRKDISFIPGRVGEATSIAVFEGLTDFLSYLTDKKTLHLENDVIVLNSAKMAERAKSFITKKGYQKVYTFFDNDKAGQEIQESFSQLKNPIISCNHIYQNFKDYNEYLKSLEFRKSKKIT